MKIAVIGKGTAGAMTLTDLKLKLDRDPSLEVDWYFDPNIKTQPVGEGTTLTVPILFDNTLNLDYTDLEKFDYTPKEGIYYYGWGGEKSFLHPFTTGMVGAHFNAVKFQNYIHEKFTNYRNVNIIEKNVSANDVDADYIIDCSGKPSELNDDYIIPEFICVNSVHVTQCYWDYPKFRHTKTIARPYGWVFMVPLSNRCSVGYLYNRNFNSLEEVKEDVKELFHEWDLSPSEDTNSFDFNNYYKKKIFDNRVLYNGNKGFFLEPMEATSIDTMVLALNSFDNYINGNLTENQVNERLLRWFKDVEFLIMIHYSVGSKWKNDFWEYAQERGQKCIEESYFDPKLHKIIHNLNFEGYENTPNQRIGPWPITSLIVNLKGLELEL